jgi:hypothetical protein
VTLRGGASLGLQLPSRLRIDLVPCCCLLPMARPYRQIVIQPAIDMTSRHKAVCAALYVVHMCAIALVPIRFAHDLRRQRQRPGALLQGPCNLRGSCENAVAVKCCFGSKFDVFMSVLIRTHRLLNSANLNRRRNAAPRAAQDCALAAEE